MLANTSNNASNSSIMECIRQRIMDENMNCSRSRSCDFYQTSKDVMNVAFPIVAGGIGGTFATPVAAAAVNRLMAIHSLSSMAKNVEVVHCGGLEGAARGKEFSANSSSSSSSTFGSENDDRNNVQPKDCSHFYYYYKPPDYQFITNAVHLNLGNPLSPTGYYTGSIVLTVVLLFVLLGLKNGVVSYLMSRRVAEVGVKKELERSLNKHHVAQEEKKKRQRQQQNNDDDDEENRKKKGKKTSSFHVFDLRGEGDEEDGSASRTEENEEELQLLQCQLDATERVTNILHVACNYILVRLECAARAYFLPSILEGLVFVSRQNTSQQKAISSSSQHIPALREVLFVSAFGGFAIMVLFLYPIYVFSLDFLPSVKVKKVRAVMDEDWVKLEMTSRMNAEQKYLMKRREERRRKTRTTEEKFLGSGEVRGQMMLHQLMMQTAGDEDDDREIQQQFFNFNPHEEKEELRRAEKHRHYDPWGKKNRGKHDRHHHSTTAATAVGPLEELMMTNNNEKNKSSSQDHLRHPISFFMEKYFPYIDNLRVVEPLYIRLAYFVDMMSSFCISAAAGCWGDGLHHDMGGSAALWSPSASSYSSRIGIIVFMFAVTLLLNISYHLFARPYLKRIDAFFANILGVLQLALCVGVFHVQLVYKKIVVEYDAHEEGNGLPSDESTIQELLTVLKRVHMLMFVQLCFFVLQIFVMFLWPKISQCRRYLKKRGEKEKQIEEEEQKEQEVFAGEKEEPQMLTIPTASSGVKKEYPNRGLENPQDKKEKETEKWSGRTSSFLYNFELLLKRTDEQ